MDAPSTPSRCGKRGQQVRGGGWSAVPAVPGRARGTSSAAAASASRGEPGAGRPRRVALAELLGGGAHRGPLGRDLRTRRRQTPPIRLEMCSASKSAISETSQPLALCLAASWGVAPAAPGAHRRPRHTSGRAGRHQPGRLLRQQSHLLLVLPPSFFWFDDTRSLDRGSAADSQRPCSGSIRSRNSPFPPGGDPLDGGRSARLGSAQK